jgi:hypothetical protein
MVSARHLAIEHMVTSDSGNGSQQHGDTSGSAGGLDDQFLFANMHSGNEESTGDEFWINGNSPLPTDSHAIQAKPNAGLAIREGTSSVAGIVDKHVSVESDIDPHRAAIDGLAIDVLNFNIGFEPAAPSGERAVPNLEIFNREQFPSVPLKLIPDLVGQRSEFIRSDAFFNAAPSLGESEGQQNQRALQHGHTLSP